MISWGDLRNIGSTGVVLPAVANDKKDYGNPVTKAHHQNLPVDGFRVSQLEASTYGHTPFMGHPEPSEMYIDKHYLYILDIIDRLI